MHRRFNTKLTPSVKHRISAPILPSAAGSNKRPATGQPPKWAAWTPSLGGARPGWIDPEATILVRRPCSRR